MSILLSNIQVVPYCGVDPLRLQQGKRYCPSQTSCQGVKRSLRSSDVKVCYDIHLRTWAWLRFVRGWDNILTVGFGTFPSTSMICRGFLFGSCFPNSHYRLLLSATGQQMIQTSINSFVSNWLVNDPGLLYKHQQLSQNLECRDEVIRQKNT